MTSVRTRASRNLIIRLGLCWAVAGFLTAARGDSVSITNLVTDDQTVNPAQITDPFLKNPWGVSHAPGGPFWVSDNGTGVATLYQVNPTTNATTRVPLVVSIPPSGAGTPTGQVFNSAGASAFNGNNFLFVSEDGTISGWRGALGTTAEVLQLADPNTVYKGATEVTAGGHSYLLSANFRAGKIDVLKGDAGAPDLSGKFTDPGQPAGFAPFNVQLLGNKVYVTYALQDAAKHDDVAGAGHGFVSAFDLQGSFLGRIASNGALNSPWGLAIAPSSFQGFAGDLLVGNFGDGRVSVFNPDPATPEFLGQLSGADGKPIAIDGLWSLLPGNDGSGGSSQSIYFSAGPDGETHGLFGVLRSMQVVPEPTSMVLALAATGVIAGRRVWKNRRRTVAAER